MKKLILLMVTTVVLFAGPQSFYANGVGRGADLTEMDSDKSAKRMMKLTGYENIRVLKNTSQGTPIDFIEAASQMTGFDKVWKSLQKAGSAWASGVKSLSEKYKTEQEQKLALKVAHFQAGIKDSLKLENFVKYITNPNSFQNELLKLGFSASEVAWMAGKSAFADDMDTLASGLKDLINNLDYDKKFPTEADKERMRKTIEAEICKGNGVNIIAHSQGNLMMDQLLNDEFPGLEHQIKLISVASPADRVYGNGLSVKLKEDLVAKTFTSSLKANDSNYPKNKQWMIPKSPETFLENLVESVSHSNYFKLYATYQYNKDNYNDWTGHGFVDSYLHDSSAGLSTNTKDKIVSQFQKNYHLLEKTFLPPNDCPIVELPEKTENLWLNEIELKGYGANLPQMKKIKFDSRVHYSSNVKPDHLKVKICYALSKKNIWDKKYFVRGPLYSTKTFTTKESSQKISNVYFYIPKTIPLGDYYLLEKVDCENKVKETDEKTNQLQYKKIKVIAQEKEDIRITQPRVSGVGSQKVIIKNTIVYDGSNPDIGWVYQAWFFSTQPKFSTAKQIAITKAQMGWGKNARKQKQLTADISALPPGTYYIWVIVKKLDNSHDDDTSNNYFRVSFTLQSHSK